MTARRIPLWIKLAHSAFIAVLVPAYWITYGPTNFLYFCDIAAFLTCVGLWLESPLLLGMQGVAILVPQMAWVVDFVGHLLGRPVLSMTGYMFDPTQPRWVRGLSLFHGWMPFLLLWVIRRVGYDRRSLPAQTAFGLALLLACYLFFAPPNTTGSARPAANVNFVYGPDVKRQQTWMRPTAWLAVVATAAVLGMFVPADQVLRRVGRRV